MNRLNAVLVLVAVILDVIRAAVELFGTVLKRTKSSDR